MKIIYEDNDLLIIDKPAGVNSDDFPKKIHRLDKDTSGILLIAKNDNSLDVFQKQFKERKVEKKYLALVIGHLKNKEGEIETLIGRSPKNGKKQKVYLLGEPKAETKRKAITKYKLIKRYKEYDLVEVRPITGRKHQIRTHFNYLGHPIAGDAVYGFKNQPCPPNLKRQFLHACELKIVMPNGEEKRFQSPLPEELKKIIEKLKKYE